MSGVRGFLTLLVVAVVHSGCAAHSLPEQEPQAPSVALIFDTDLGPDSDDAGALALIHALADLGEAEILGVNCSTRNPWCAPAADAINTYYGRPSVPVGTLKGPGSAGTSSEWYGDSFNGYIAGRFPNRIGHGEHAEDAVVLYRRLLARRPDTSAVVVATGPLTNLRDLIESEPDSLSPLTGLELIRRKVRLLSVMGGKYPEGAESNFVTDGPAARKVADAWPTFVMFSGYEIGEDLLTGQRLWTETDRENPVRQAYHLWDLYFARRFDPDFDPSSGIWPHSSYDQTSVLYAVRGLGDYWDAHDEGNNSVADDGSNRWISAPIGNHAYLLEKMPREELASIIENLMIAPPRRYR